MNWATLPHAMKEFTTHDVYDAIHSAETSGAASDALRSLWKYDKKLNRRESVDGNRKIFFYSLNNDDQMRGIMDEKVIKTAPYIEVKEQTDVGKGISFSPNNTQYKHFGGISNAGSMQGITGTEPDNKTQKQSNQQIEIPNNFCIELKTPNGFTITIRGGNENTN